MLKINKYPFSLRLMWKLLVTTNIRTNVERHCLCTSLSYNIYGGVPLKAMTSEAPQEPKITAVTNASFWLQGSEEQAGGSNLKASLLKLNSCSRLRQN